jgi:ribosomal protein S18 acetylase RimI-like enzyme
MTDTADVDRVVIRPIRESDLPALEWDGEYTKFRDVYRHAYDDMLRGQRLLLVAVDDSAMVGQVFIQLSSSELQFADGATRGYLYSLRVRPGWQGHGIGTRLISAAEAALRQRGFRTAIIAAAKDNEGARRLYERLGYRVFAADPGVWYFTDVNGTRQTVEEPCWVMHKQLDETG